MRAEPHLRASHLASLRAAAAPRRGFRLILSQHPGEFDVVGEAGTGEEALRLVRELSPDLIILDVAMPRMNGVEVAK